MKIQKAKMELVPLDAQNIITASTGGGGSSVGDPFVSFAGFGNRNRFDNTIIISGTPYTYTNQETFCKDLNDAFKTESIAQGQEFEGTDVSLASINNFYTKLNDNPAAFEGLNGTWKWISNQFVKQTQ